MTAYVRFQPRGEPLSGHTSRGSDEEPLPPGYVFAYDRPLDAFDAEGALRWPGGPRHFPEDWEVITFWGERPFDPGDYEGVAVVPRRILNREPIRQWVERMAERPGDLGEAANDWLEFYAPESWFE